MFNQIRYDNNQKKVILLVIFLLIIIGLIHNRDHLDLLRSSSFIQSSSQIDALKAEPLPELIWELRGLVKKEGIYYLPQNAVLKDAVRMAEGLKKRVYPDPSDIGIKPESGSRIIIGKTSLKVERLESEKLLTLFIPLSLNRASKEDLMALPGIGEKIATSIIEYRKDYGPFSSVEGLKDIRGIGDHKLKIIERYLTP